MLGMPIAWVLGSLSAFYVVIEGFPLSILAHKVANSAATYPMLAVPLFMFAGKIMNSSGITTRIFNFADNVVGHIPGRAGSRQRGCESYFCWNVGFTGSRCCRFRVK